MDYLFLHRDKRTFTSERQRNLLFRAARLYWEQKYACCLYVRLPVYNHILFPGG